MDMDILIKVKRQSFLGGGALMQNISTTQPTMLSSITFPRNNTIVERNLKQANEMNP